MRFDAKIRNANAAATMCWGKIHYFSTSVEYRRIFKLPTSIDVALFTKRAPPILSTIAPKMSRIESFVIGPYSYWLLQMVQLDCSHDCR